ncbi:MAG: bifunctional metallophosphatase/5'-nucleotidase [FCB group bacterium]|nr:bifunctional metallophosphatase/5'-nucleotidase [FCB group bacterium]
MNRRFVFCLMTSIIFVFTFLSAQQGEIANLIASQRTDGSQIVDIFYDLIGDEEAYTITVEVSFDGGMDFLTVNAILGASAAGEAIIPGIDKWIGWSIGEDFPDQFNETTRIKITAVYDETIDYNRQLTILYTNDEHGWLVREGNTGGVSELMGQWRQVEGYTEDGPFLILSGGDNWTGPAISTWFKGESTVEAMNAMQYDVSTIGNHEFDFGQDILQTRIEEAYFPYLSANMVREDNGEQHELALPYTIKVVNGIHVGIIGLTFLGADDINFPESVENIDFIDYAGVLNEVVPQVRAEGAELLVVTSHMCDGGVQSIMPLLNELGVTFIGGGHCHWTISEIVDGVGHIEAGSNFSSYGKVIIGYNILEDVVTNLEVSTHLNEGLYTDQAVADVVAYWQAQLQNDLSEVIGFVENEVGDSSDPMFNLITDSWLEAYPADISFTNRGGIRQPMPPGDITIETWVGILPFENFLYEIELTGQQLMDSVGPYVVGGMTTIPTYQLADGTPIDPNATYSVLLTDYIYQTEGNFSVMDPTPYETSIHWRTPCINWISSKNTSIDDPLDNYLDYTPRQ